jgi:hypothetical protein
MALPQFSGQVSVRGGKGERGGGQVGVCSASRASGQPRGGLDQVVHLQLQIGLEFPHLVFDKMPARN